MVLCDYPLPPPDTMLPGATTRFLMAEARNCRTPVELLTQYAEALCVDGVPVERAFLLTPTLHPQVAALSFTWRRDRAGVEVIERNWADMGIAGYTDSPLRRIAEGTHRVIRRALHDPSTPRDFPVVRELEEQGFTDYLVAGIPGNAVVVRPTTVSWSTRAAGGFSAAQVERCLSSLSLLAPLLDAHIDRHVASRLLGVYVGADAGAQILAGKFRRGDGGSIRAAICFTDLRDFTALSDRLPRDELLELLNAYFDCVVSAVETAGGEVLKFIGDAVLAVFRADDVDAAVAANKALAAARGAFARVDVANDARVGRMPIEFGMSIHVGEVQYGNIGGERRLDFTVIGPAVNLASRIQGLCRPLGKRLLVSDAFVSATGAACEDLGPRVLKGVAEEVRIFSPL
jgi:adenylate cyclase